uniref:DAK2 domain-containing protein n=1 Tax=uncultured Corynebacterium sp. TaxID=159447 RepID=UPI0025D57EB6
VLSQVLRGVAQAAAEGDLDAASVADALSNAVVYVERAITDPVEGTIVTVLRKAAIAAQEALGGAAGESPLDAVTSAAVTAAEEALEQTPSQLAELRDAGVVDAGGRGLVLLLTALRDEVAGRAADIPDPSSLASVTGSAMDSAADSAPVGENESGESHGHAGWLEVMFFFTGPVDELENALAGMGTSLVIARATDTEAQIHIHSLNAGAVIERAYELGAVSDLRLEVLPDALPASDSPASARIIVAMTPEGSIAEFYRQAGAVPVTAEGGLSEAITEAIAAADARELVVLPNGHAGPDELKQIAEAVKSEGAQAAILSTMSLVGGIAALAVHDPRLPLEAAAAQMDEAAADMRAADVVRTAGGNITVVAPVDEVLAEEETVQRAVDKACRAMLDAGGELVTLLLDSDAAEELDPDALQETLNAEVLVYPADGLGTIGQIGVE